MCILVLQRYLLLLTFKSRSRVPHLYKAAVQISKAVILEWISFMWLVQFFLWKTHCGCHPFTIQTSQHAESCVQPSVAQCLWVCSSWDWNSRYTGHLCSGESHPGGSGTFRCCFADAILREIQCQSWATVVKDWGGHLPCPSVKTVTNFSGLLIAL